MKRYAPFVLLLLLAGCTVTVPRPGSIDQLDSQTYDTLLIFQGLLDSAKDKVKEGKLPESMKPLINQAGEVYKELRKNWLAYHYLPSTDNAAKITGGALEVSKFIAQLRALGVKP